MDVEAVFQSRRVDQMVRLAKSRSGQLLITVRGHAFVLDEGRISSLAGVRIKVIRGPDSGRSVTTGADGAYELGVVPGTLAILATRVGTSRPSSPLTLDLVMDASTWCCDCVPYRP